MSTPAVFLLAASLALLLRVVVGRRNFGRSDRVAWALVAALAAWQLLDDGLRIAFVPIYILVGIVAIAAIVRHVRHHRDLPLRRRYLVARIALVTLSLPLAAVPVIDAVVVPIAPDDLRDESWSAAFDELHHSLRAHYAFGEWKRVDWDRLHETYSPAVVAAERTGDADAYYRAVRSYIYAIPDGHLGIDGAAHHDARFADIGGGFGFGVARLDGGTFIAHTVDPDGPAAVAGIAWGAQIIDWDGEPIDEAIAATPTLWASRPSATLQTMAIAKQQLVTRAPVAEARRVTFRNPGGPVDAATLVASDDGYRTLDRPGPSAPGDGAPAVTHHLLDGGVGFIRIASLETVAGVDPAEAMDRSMRALGHASALILDVRGNRGGWDGYVPKMMSYFTPDRLLYEHIALPSPIGDGHLRLHTLHVEPNELQFTRPVVVLIDDRTKSSGEGFALIARRLPNVELIGMTATDGSFGMAGGSVLLPTDIEVTYPIGVSLDADGLIQLDGDHLLQGGVEPETFVPLTFATAESIYLHGDDVELDHAQRLLRQLR